MAQQPPDGKFSNLGLRLITGAVLAPPVFFALYIGSPWFDLVVLAAACAMIWELTRICSAGRFGAVGWVLEAGTVLAIAAIHLDQTAIAVVIVIGTAALGGLMSGNGDKNARNWLMAGVLLIGFFGVAFIIVRSHLADGRNLIIWLVCAVWATDTGAYFAGKFIGGPKLAPLISPKKTWAGLAGGVIAATVWSVYWLAPEWGDAAVTVALVGVATALIAQLGDLSISVLKRRFDVKDASALIPGHGGVLDRLDGMLLAGPMAAIVMLALDKGWI